ncbi:MAG: FimB/Mfa2 family fimbrial subunit [Bacteroidaceae bacterium]|nr:FimB/Mfa2 family fimbrial subunit [Bacteroidaceae bacterium]
MKIVCKLLFVVLGLLTACQQIELPEQPDTSKKVSVTVMARSTTAAEVQYPLSVYAFNSAGECVAQQTIRSNSEALNLSLSKGDYRVVALSGYDGYTLPSGTPNIQSRIKMPAPQNMASSPLQYGAAAVVVGTTKARVSIAMNYQVANVNLQLAGVPAEMTAVAATVEQQYSELDFAGESFAPKSSTITLMRQSDGTWSASNAYLFVGTGSKTNLTLSLTDAQQSKFYSAALSSPLRAGTPYTIKGTYADEAGSQGMSLSGDIQSANWLPVVDASFVFGPSAPTPPESPSDGNESTTAAPTAGTIWKGKHFIALVESVSSNSADLVLLSKQNWEGVLSGYNTTDPTDAQYYASQYSEDGLTGWTIPTESEAQQLATTYGGTTLTTLRDQMRQVGGDPVYDNFEGNNVRYLCAEALSTYSFRDTKILKAGATVKTYHLRLVKRVRVAW